VRDLFKRGAASAPCIIFIDELDALAKVSNNCKYTVYSDAGQDSRASMYRRPG
jgi:ATP-dependent Zn protease